MDRRTFLNVSGLAGVGALGAGQTAAAAEGYTARDYYELRQYVFDSEEQVAGFDTFMQDVAIPAFNRHGLDTVGVFKSEKEFSPVWVLLRHSSLESVGGLTQALLNDKEFLAQGSAFLDASAKTPAYTRVESSLFAAFSGMTTLERPVENAGRVVQLRIYESPSVKTGQKKIEMFNTKEIDIFRKTGLNPVFFGECLIGAKMPNLTYMLAFENEEALKAGWKTFLADPEWKELRAMPEYADDKILCGITNHVLVPTDYSQV
jgi:hypothetical protein